jgi:4-hydroxy-3-polyprenylbenzoate decarboxylase
MIHDKNRLGFYISPGKHGRIHRDKFMERGEKMPVCVVIGADPLTYLMGCNKFPRGICEYDISGAYRGKPVEVVRGKVTGLPIPANAEIVLEGWVYPNDVHAEGPFGEWTGYFGSPESDAPVLTVEAVYHRNDPIITGAPPQRPPGENSRYRSVMQSALIHEDLVRAGVPDVKGTWAHEIGGARMLIGVAIKQRYPGHARQAGHIASQCGAGAYAGKYVVVVDEDVDVSDLDDLMWAMVFRSDPATSIDIINNAWSTPLDPSIPPWEKEKKNYVNSRAIIDACRPFFWKDKYPRVNTANPRSLEKVRKKFGDFLK